MREKQEKQEELQRFSELLIHEINSTLKRGTFYAAILGSVLGVLMIIAEMAGYIDGYIVPGSWAVFAGGFSLVMYYLAKSELIKGNIQYAVFIPFISIPSVLYIVAFFILPSGAATYITGPPSYLYVFLVIMTGFLFNPTLSVISGFIVGIEYFIVYLISQPYLVQISTPDPLQLQDLVHPSVYVIKSVMMIFCGIIVGILSKNTKKLINEILSEEKEKLVIDKLFGQFVSNEVKDKIIAEKRDMPGERKQVAILFSDIRSFTSYCEHNTPELIIEQLNEYFERMVFCITSHGGVIDKFIGDAIMAVFGGVIDLDNPSEKSLKAAEMMQSELKTLNEEWSAKGFPQLQNGIGIHYGEVLQGTIGSKNRKEFTVIGDAVNVASRLEGLTKEYKTSIILSQDSYQQLKSSSRKNLANLDQTTVKGRKDPVIIWGKAKKESS
ncbi:MAG: adenylate/guanylate cyclase domain-containing protein [Proteobacteria bacterium]|nr:adenylate/guanylate cyclase domain-containing protein [Pseudomonadota bacterium]